MALLGKSRGLLLSLVVLAVSSIAPTTSFAQYKDFDQFGAELSKELDSQPIQRLAVAVFAASGGASTEQGRYFSELLANSIQHHLNRLKISSSVEFEKELRNKQLAAQAVSSRALAGQFTAQLKEDALIVGSLARDDHDYDLELSVFRPSEGKILFSERTQFPRTKFMDSLNAPFPPASDTPIFKAGTNGVGFPSCGNPRASPHKDRGMIYHRRATIVFDVLISKEGRVVAQRPVELVGDELDEISFEQNGTLSCKPAKDAKNQPVNVIFPLETSFTLTD